MTRPIGKPVRGENAGIFASWARDVDLSMFPLEEIEDGEVPVRPTLRRVEGEWEDPLAWTALASDRPYVWSERETPIDWNEPEPREPRAPRRARHRRNPCARWDGYPIVLPLDEPERRRLRDGQPGYDEYGLPREGVWAVIGPPAEDEPPRIYWRAPPPPPISWRA